MRTRRTRCCFQGRVVVVWRREMRARVRGGTRDVVGLKDGGIEPGRSDALVRNRYDGKRDGDNVRDVGGGTGQLAQRSFLSHAPSPVFQQAKRSAAGFEGDDICGCEATLRAPTPARGLSRLPFGGEYGHVDVSNRADCARVPSTAHPPRQSAPACRIYPMLRAH